MTTEFLETEQPEVEQPRADIGQPIMSGHCLTPSTSSPEESHQRCARMGSGSRANPAKRWHPCPCFCHLGDQYECGNCGRTIAEAPYWEGLGHDEVYVHIDGEGNAIAEDCG